MAVATKRDSSAMKIIAVLTTLFLPGTFVAVSSYQFYSYKNDSIGIAIVYYHAEVVASTNESIDIFGYATVRLDCI